MDMKSAVNELLAKGRNTFTLADELGTTQATVSRISTGKTKSPRYETAKRIEALWEKECGAKTHSAA